MQVYIASLIIFAPQHGAKHAEITHPHTNEHTRGHRITAFPTLLLQRVFIKKTSLQNGLWRSYNGVWCMKYPQNHNAGIAGNLATALPKKRLNSTNEKEISATIDTRK